MASSSKPEYNGPFFVLLGGNTPGMWFKKRPAKIALGDYKPLVPIVVTCATRDDADIVYSLNDVIMRHIRPTDNHSMAYRFQRSPVTDIELESTPIYAIRVGKQTGIWIGFAWDSIASNIRTGRNPKPDQLQPVWRKAETLSEALVYMVNKEGFNLPLLPAGTDVPPPEPDEATKGNDNIVDGVPSTTPKRKLKNQPKGILHSALSSESPPPLATPHRVRLLEPSSSRRTQVAVQRSQSDESPLATSEVDDSLSCALAASVNISELLRNMIHPPLTMRPRPESIPIITFGERADALLRAVSASELDLLTVLRTRVHADNVESFAYHLSMSLGWELSLCKSIWDKMVYPQ